MPKTLPPPTQRALGLSIVAPITGYSDIPKAGLHLPAWLFASRSPALPHAVTQAGESPGEVFGVFECTDAFGIQGPGIHPSRPHLATRRLRAALADYLATPPPEADGPQLNAARALHLTL